MKPAASHEAQHEHEQRAAVLRSREAPRAPDTTGISIVDTETGRRLDLVAHEKGGGPRHEPDQQP